MNDENENNKTIMIRRSPVSEAEPAQPAAKPVAKQSEPRKDNAAWLKSPLGMIGIIIAVAVLAFALVKMTGK